MAGKASDTTLLWRKSSSHQCPNRDPGTSTGHEAASAQTIITSPLTADVQ